jgi:hypothetical protein
MIPFTSFIHGKEEDCGRGGGGGGGQQSKKDGGGKLKGKGVDGKKVRKAE